MELRGIAEELHWQAYLSVGFARKSQLYVFVTWSCNITQSTELEGLLPAYYWMIRAGQLNRECLSNTIYCQMGRFFCDGLPLGGYATDELQYLV